MKRLIDVVVLAVVLGGAYAVTDWLAGRGAQAHVAATTPHR
jgi:hypothetical protein